MFPFLISYFKGVLSRVLHNSCLMMKKQHSKSTLPKKGKTTTLADTRKNRVTKTQSCIKISSQTEHNRAVHQSRIINGSQVSKHQNSRKVQYDAVQTTQTQIIERPGSSRTRHIPVKSSHDTVPNQTNRDEGGDNYRAKY